MQNIKNNDGLTVMIKPSLFYNYLTYSLEKSLTVIPVSSNL